MCGIAGFQQVSEVKHKSILPEMMRAIKHRGPDDEGMLEIDHTAFGHVRLSIIDILYGKQPMSTVDGRYHITYNGEIYNYLELRQELVQKGHPLKTYSDTEVLLYLYAEYGNKMLHLLNGMFAFALYDKQEKTIFIARDHFGIKPFYYFQGKDELIFASEIKALLKHPSVKAQINDEALHEYLTFQFVMGRNTLFKNICKLEPAHYMTVREGKIQEYKRYWDLDFTVNESRSVEEFADELLVLLDNSCSIQIRSDVPVGAHLSGGIDSSIVAMLASKNYCGNFKTFTGGFKDSPDYDESHFAAIVSKEINSEHHTVFPKPEDFVKHFEKLIYHLDEPEAGPGLFPQYMVSELASKKVKVVLGGQGGDEVFGGYTRYAVAYLEQCLKGAIFETQEEGRHVVTLSSIIENMPQLRNYIPLIQNLFSSGLFENMDKRYYRLIDRSPSLHEIYSSGFLSYRNEERIFEKFSSIFNRADTLSYFNKMSHFDIATLLPALLHVEDRVSMAVSLESRVPLLDKRIVELAAQMPPTMKFAGGKTKFMLIKAVENILPSKIRERKDKMGFPTPINEWMAGPLKEYALDIFNSKTTKERGLLKTEKIEAQIKRGGKFSRDLWGALNLEIWFRTFID